jgi:hypothetical protein
MLLKEFSSYTSILCDSIAARLQETWRRILVQNILR